MPRVLVVDDNAVIVELVEAFLALEGLDVQHARNGREALAILRADPPDIMLLDLMMPEIDGYGVLDAMEADPRLLKIPTIIVSAKDQPDAQIRAWRGPVVGFVTKPFNPNALAALVHRVLESEPLSVAEREAEIARLKIASQGG